MPSHAALFSHWSIRCVEWSWPMRLHIKNALQLLFPLASGFALVGPFVAVGLYEMSTAA